LRGANAADIDAFGIVSVNVGGYVNNDTAGIGNPVQSTTPDIVGAWETKTSGVYEYYASISLDSIVVNVRYTATSQAHGVVYIGKTTPNYRLFQRQAKGLISTVTAGSIGTQKKIRLDRDITAMLKNPDFSDVATQQTLFFQAFASSIADSPDFAMTQRIPMIAGTLATVSGATEFEISVAGTKLDAVSGRYDDGRGAGDSVRLMSETNITICGADNGFSLIVFSATSNTALSAWDAVGGQAAQLDTILANTTAHQASDQNPVDNLNRYGPALIYAVNNDTNATLVAQPDTNGAKDVGALIGLAMIPNNALSDYQFFRHNGDLQRRSRCLSGTELAAPSGFTDPLYVWAVGGDR
jgi:hypothetical protein